MELESLVSPERVAFIESTDRAGALDELLACFASDVARAGSTLSHIREQLQEREKLVTTRVSAGIAIPHARVGGIEHPLVGFGISREGIGWDDQHEESVKLVVMILWSETTDVQILSEVARRLSREEIFRRMVAAQDPLHVIEAFASPTTPDGARVSTRQIVLAREMTRHAADIAQAVGARGMILHIDAVGTTRFLEPGLYTVPIIFVTADPSRYQGLEEYDVVTLPFRGMTKQNVGDLSLLFVLSQGMLNRDDKIISVYGEPESGTLDTISFTDVGASFDVFFAIHDSGGDAKPTDLADVVYNRAVQLAHELAIEGREGKPIGALFVLGDHEEVMKRAHQLVVNPFLGYPEDQRNILDPSLEETVKEFSRIDGAFLIRGDGVIESAGLYLRTQTRVEGMPSGLGARHAAAAAITAETAAVAVCVSESTRRISIFRRGSRLMVF